MTPTTDGSQNISMNVSPVSGLVLNAEDVLQLVQLQVLPDSVSENFIYLSNGAKMIR